MISVAFSHMDDSNKSIYWFRDKFSNSYALYVDGSTDCSGLNKDFFEKFYFSKNIKVEHKNVDGKNVIYKIISY